MPRRGLAAGASLLVLCACAKPDPSPWPEQVRAALARRPAAVAAGEGREFEAGFRNGAEMVHEALKAGLRPFRPVLGRAAAPRRLGPLPEGVRLEAPRPVADLDPDTGLLLIAAAGGGQDAFARGQAQGFDWALEMVGRELVRPLARPSLPETWVPWEELQGGAGLVSGSRTVGLRWAPGLLAWAATERGFPEQRGWRPWNEAAPVFAGLSREVLWVETPAGEAVAIELPSAGILEVRPAPAHPDAARTDWDRHLAAEAARFRSPEYQKALAGLRREAGAGSLPSMVALAMALKGMGAQAEAEAYGWLLKAAERGDPGAMVNVAVRLHHGQGVAADRAAAARWLDRAAAAGLPEAAELKAMLAEAALSPAAPAPSGSSAAPPPR